MSDTKQSDEDLAVETPFDVEKMGLQAAVNSWRPIVEAATAWVRARDGNVSVKQYDDIVKSLVDSVVALHRCKRVA